MVQKVKDLTDRKRMIRNRAECIMDKDGKLLFESEDIRNRWVAYIRDLYSDDNRGEMKEQADDNSGPSITKDEIRAALKK